MKNLILTIGLICTLAACSNGGGNGVAVDAGKGKADIPGACKHHPEHQGCPPIPTP